MFELFVVFMVFVVMPVVFFLGGVAFGRKHQAKIDGAIRKAERLKAVAEE